MLQNYNNNDFVGLSNKPKTSAYTKKDRGLRDGAALERPPLGAVVGDRPKPEPVEGTVGVVLGMPPATAGAGAGAGEKNESWGKVVGGLTSAGN